MIQQQFAQLVLDATREKKGIAVGLLEQALVWLDESFEYVTIILLLSIMPLPAILTRSLWQTLKTTPQNPQQYDPAVADHRQKHGNSLKQNVKKRLQEIIDDEEMRAKKVEEINAKRMEERAAKEAAEVCFVAIIIPSFSYLNYLPYSAKSPSKNSDKKN